MLSHSSYKSRDPVNSAILTRNDPVIYEPENKPKITTCALSPGQRGAYHDQGFLIMPELFSSQEVQALHDEMQVMRKSLAHQHHPEVIFEPGSDDVRSIFHVHHFSALFANLMCDPRVLNVAREILGTEVYIHQSRINYKPGFSGKEFYWHSDFETWHIEDGMPTMRALSCSILLTDNSEANGPLMLIPGSHHHFIACHGLTPEDNYKKSLKRQEIGVPDQILLSYLTDLGGITSATGKAGSVVFFDCNTMHGSNGNITPFPRSNIFFVYNSVENKLQAPRDGLTPRPEYIAARHGTEALHPAPLAIHQQTRLVAKA